MCPWAGQAPRVAGSPVPGAESRQLMEHGFLSRVVCPGGGGGHRRFLLLAANFETHPPALEI